MRKLFLKSMLLLCALIVGSNVVWAASNVSTVSTKFSAGGNVTSNFTQTGDMTSASWNLAVTWKSSASWQNLDGTKGAQVGSGSKPATGIVLTGSSISGTISQVVVNTSGASSVNATVAVSVGGTGFTCGGNSTASLTSSAANYTFTGSGSGDVVITWVNSSDKALYIKSVTTTYTTGGATPNISLNTYSVNAPDAESDGTITVTYNNIASVDAEVLFFASDGTTPADYSSWLEAEINGANNVYYVIGANTGAARTAYMKVHQKNTEVYSSLITVSQAKKSVASPEFSLEAGTYIAGTGVNITSAGNTVYYTLKTDGTDAGTPSSSSTQFTTPIVLGNCTTKIKAIAYDTYGNYSGVVSRTYYGIAPAVLPFSFEGGTNTDLVACQGVVGYSLGAYAENNAPYRVQFNATDDYVVIYTDEKPVKMTIGVKMIGGGSTSKFTIQESVDGIEYSDVEELTISGSQNDVLNLETTKAFASTTRAIKMLFTKGSNVGVGPISITCQPATITLNATCTDGDLVYGTFSYPKAFIVPEGITVSAVKINAGHLDLSATYSTGDVVAANTGVLVSSETAGEKTVVLSSEAGTTIDGNLLYPGGVTAEEMATAHPSCKYYKLALERDGEGEGYVASTAGFYWGADQGAAFTSGANKAYLAVPTTPSNPTAPSAFRFTDEENNATSINDIEASDKAVKFIENGRILILRDGITYDALGRKVR